MSDAEPRQDVAPGSAAELRRQDMLAIAKMQMELAESNMQSQERIAALRGEADVRRHGMACLSVCICLFLVLAFCLAGLWIGQGDLTLRMMDKLITTICGVIGGAGGVVFLQGRRGGKRDDGERR